MNSLEELYSHAKYKFYRESHIRHFVCLQKKADGFAKRKWWIILIFITGITAFHVMSPASNLTKSGFQMVDYFHILAALLLNVLIAFFMHKCAYMMIQEKPFPDYPFGQTKPGVSFKFGEHFFFFLFSPDLYYANWFKNEIKHHHIYCDLAHCKKDCLRDQFGNGICLRSWDMIRIKTKFFVEYSNWMNLCLSSMIVFATVILYAYFEWKVYFLFILILLRTLSRFLEIGIAFYKDIINVHDKVFSTVPNKGQIYIHRWKSTLLLKSSRLSLAVHSLLEAFILYAAIYYFIFLYEGDCLEIFKSIDHVGFLNFLLYSISVSVFNFSFTNFPSTFWSMVHISQVILSFVLIILSIAAYLGANTQMLKRDEKLYMRVHKKMNEKCEERKEALNVFTFLKLLFK